MKIYEAIIEVMRIKGKALSAKEAYKEIIKHGLYEFGAANPANVVNTLIKRHCKGIPQKKGYSKTKYFEARDGNKYYFLDSPEVIQRSREREYWLPKTNPSRSTTLQEIALSSNTQKKAILKEWFLSDYKPFPRTAKKQGINVDDIYNVIDVIGDEFSEILEPNFLAEVSDEIEHEFRSKQWLKRPNDEDIDDYYLDTDYYGNFKASVESIKLLNAQSNILRSDIQQSLNRMLYANIITAMESYLSDAFINTVTRNEKYVRNLVETTPELRDRRLNLGDIFKQLESLDQEVRHYLTSRFVWHRLERVKTMYQYTLGINFPDQLDSLISAVLKRHSLVHRNGKTEEGDNLLIREKDIKQLLAQVEPFIASIDEQLRDKK